MANDIKIVIKAVDEATAPLKNVSRSMKDMEKDSKGLKLGWTELNSALSLAEKGFGAVKKIMDQTIGVTVNYARSVSDLGLELGVTSEEASALYQIADDLKIPVGNLEMAFKQAVKNGIQPNIDTLKDLSKEYQGIKDPVKRAQFAMDTFGMRAGPEMQKLLSATPAQIDEMAKSAKDAGLIMGIDAVRGAREYEIAVDNLDDAAMGLKMTLGKELMPIVTDFLDLLSSSKAVKAMTFIIEAGFGEYYRDVFDPAVRAANRSVGTQTDMIEILHGAMDGAGEATFNFATAEDQAREKAGYLNDIMGPLNEKLLFNRAAAGMDADAAILLATNMGLVDDETKVALDTLDRLRDKYDTNADGAISATEAAAGYSLEVDRLGEAIDALHDQNITITTEHIDNYVTTYEGAPPPSGTRRVGGEQEYQHDADFTVPPGYPNDSYGPIYVSSGERVKVIPSGQNYYNQQYHFHYTGNATAQQVSQSYEMARLMGK